MSTLLPMFEAISPERYAAARAEAEQLVKSWTDQQEDDMVDVGVKGATAAVAAGMPEAFHVKRFANGGYSVWAYDQDLGAFTTASDLLSWLWGRMVPAAADPGAAAPADAAATDEPAEQGVG